MIHPLTSIVAGFNYCYIPLLTLNMCVMKLGIKNRWMQRDADHFFNTNKHVRTHPNSEALSNITIRLYAAGQKMT